MRTEWLACCKQGDWASCPKRFNNVGEMPHAASNGASATESWVGSAIQPYPAFVLIRVIRGQKLRFSLSLRDLASREAPPCLLGRFGITENRLDWLLDRNQRIQNPWYCVYRKFSRRDSTALLPEQHRVSVDRENPPLANA